jgi:hypothetical protein
LWGGSKSSFVHFCSRPTYDLTDVADAQPHPLHLLQNPWLKFVRLYSTGGNPTRISFPAIVDIPAYPVKVEGKEILVGLPPVE